MTESVLRDRIVVKQLLGSSLQIALFYEQAQKRQQQRPIARMTSNVLLEPLQL